MFLFGKKINLSFVHAVTGAAVGNATLKADRIPETFTAETTVEINGEEWQVVSAEPASRREYKKAGAITVKVRKPGEPDAPAQVPAAQQPPVSQPAAETLPVDTIPAAETPSQPESLAQPVAEPLAQAEPEPQVIQHEAALPQGGQKPPFRLRTEFWRALEFITADQRSSIETGLSTALEMVGAARDRQLMELRQQIAAPLETAGLSPFALRQQWFPQATSYGGLDISGMGGLITGGFAFQQGGLDFYGKARPDAVEVFGIGGMDPAGLDRDFEGTIAGLIAFMQGQNLVLVDWARMLVAGPEAEALRAFFGKA